jgi:hypothetical protein
MASTKYIGYLGGAAIAAGVGAAIAVAGAATASAESEADAPKTESPTTESGVQQAKPLEKLTDRIEKLTSAVTKAATPSKPTSSADVGSSDSKLSDAGVSATQITVRKPTAKQFEAEQVERLKGLFQPREAATAPAAAKSDNDAVSTQADEQGIPNPFRADDPDPVDVPETVVAVRDQLVGAAPEALAPYIREGVEQAYRTSQMIPWVNAIVPITKIVPLIGPATGDGTTALAARQAIVNELIKTTPPGSFLYYGYDLVADLANQEEAAAALKEQAFTGVWDLLDFGNFLHNDGESGIGNAL